MTNPTGSSPPTRQSVPDGPRPRLSAKDLINTAVFAAIFLVVTYVFGMLSFFGPLMWLLSVPIAIVVNGITFMLFLTRVGHAGMISLFAVVMAVFFLLHGGALVGAAATIVIGLVTEVVAYAGKYRSKWASIAAYTVFGVAAFTPFLPIVINREAFFDDVAREAMGEEFVRAAGELFTLPVMSGIAALCLVSGFVGALFGTAVLRKHFVGAGLA